MSKNNDSIANKVRLLYRDKNNKKDLRKYVHGFTETTLQSLVKNNMMTSNGCDLLDGLLYGLAESSEDLNKRFMVMELVLNELHESKIPESMIRTMLSSILFEMPHLLSEQLIKLIEGCINSISNNNDNHTSWKEILPECLRLLSARSGIITHCDTSLSTSEFVSRSLRSLFQSKWPLPIITPLTVMFQDINLSKDEHLEVVNKLCFELDKISSDSLPPLIHQLLRLCKTQHGPIVYFRLNDYFYTRLYKDNEFKDTLQQESESPIMDFDTIDVINDDSFYKAEATCIYHACRGGGALKKLLVTLKTLVRRPSVLLSAPTLIQMLLAVEHHKENYIQIIRSYLQHNYMEELRRKEFSWCNDTINSTIDVKQLMTTLVENSAKYCHITGEGLLHLAMSLIGTGGLLPTTNSMQELGTYLLVKLIKKKSEAAQQALKMLRDKLGTDSTNIQNVAETLKALFVYMPHTMMEFTSISQGILEDCFIVPEGRDWADHCLVIEAFSNVIRLDSRLRDTLVMVCRKGLFSRDPGIGRIAVCGYMCLMKSLKCSSESFSQDNSNTFSILSQISQNCYAVQAGSGITNGTVCMEVVSLLRRCFIHSKEVRDYLYTGLPYAIYGRSDLSDPIFNILYEHLTTHYYISDTETLPPLNLKNCLDIRDDSITLQEPLGRLLFTIQKLLLCDQPAPGNDEPGGWSLSGAPEKFYGISGKLYVIMLSLSNRMSKCLPVHFNEDNGISLNEIGLESKEKCLILQQAMLCCEALMAFRINEWTPTKGDQPQKLLNLHKIYYQLFDFTKANLSKTKKDSSKKGKKGKKIDTTINNDDNNTKNKKGKKEPLKLSDMAKNKSVGFKVLPTVWDLYTLSRSFELLYEPTVDWTTADQLNQIHTKRDLHKSVAKLGIGVIANLKSKRITQQERREIFKCAKCLYVNCVSNLNVFSNFDQETSLLVVECFHNFLQLIINRLLEYLPEFLDNIGAIQGNTKIGEKISIIAEALGIQLELAITDAPLNEDPAAEKIIPALFNIISDLLQQLPPDMFICDKWINWLQKLTSKSSNSMKTLVSPVISTMLNLVAKSADTWSVCETLAKKLIEIMGVNEDKENVDENSVKISEFEMLTPASSPGVCLALCAHLSSRFSAIEMVIGRLRADHGFIQYRRSSQIPTAQSSLKIRERAVCSELYRGAAIVQQLASILCPAGPCCYAIIRIVSKLHALLSALTAHFTGRDSRSIQSSRFERLVKISGKNMSRTIDGLISHVEGLREGNVPSGSKGQASIIKDTKFIPRLVYNCELFYKRIHQLCAKTKLNYVCHLSKGNARDFRIKASTVKEVLKSYEADHDIEDPEASAMDVDDDSAVDITHDQSEVAEDGTKDDDDIIGEDSDTEMDEQ